MGNNNDIKKRKIKIFNSGGMGDNPRGRLVVK
jgi:hypothetical protein